MERMPKKCVRFAKQEAQKALDKFNESKPQELLHKAAILFFCSLLQNE